MKTHINSIGEALTKARSKAEMYKESHYQNKTGSRYLMPIKKEIQKNNNTLENNRLHRCNR